MQWCLKSPALIVYSTIYPGEDQRKHQSSGLLTCEFPTQRASNAENVSIWWYHHAINDCPACCYLAICLQFSLIPCSLISWTCSNHITTSWMPLFSDYTRGVSALQGPGPWFSIKMPSYQYRKSHCGDKTVVRSSYLHSGISYTGKMASLYWISHLVEITGQESGALRMGSLEGSINFFRRITT